MGVYNTLHQPPIDFGSEYEPTRPLGEGAYGRVYLCRHLRSGEERAVKVIERGNRVSAESIGADDSICRQ
jgi:serine/threonine protein kinase